MRAEKKFISAEYLARLNASPFVLLVEYKGLTVAQFTEFRKRLTKVGAQGHVVKNSIFRAAAKDAGLGDLSANMSGQMAAVTGSKDVSAAAKVLKTFETEFDKPKIRFGFLGNQQLSTVEIKALADLPSIDVLRQKLLGLIQAPATQLARMIAAPGTQLARVVQAYADKK